MREIWRQIKETEQERKQMSRERDSRRIWGLCRTGFYLGNGFSCYVASWKPSVPVYTMPGTCGKLWETVEATVIAWELHYDPRPSSFTCPTPICRSCGTLCAQGGENKSYFTHREENRAHFRLGFGNHDLRGKADCQPPTLAHCCLM